MQHRIFSIQSSVSHDPSEGEFLGIFRWIDSSKEQHLFEIEIFSKIQISLLPRLNNLLHPCWKKSLTDLSKSDKSYVFFFFFLQKCDFLIAANEAKLCFWLYLVVETN